MKKLIPFLFALGSVAASAQSVESAVPITVRLDSLPGNARLATGLAGPAALTQLGLHVDSGDWHFDLALPEASSTLTTSLVAGQRSLRMGQGEVNVGISRSFGATPRAGSFWDLGNFSLVANAGYAASGHGMDENLRTLWSGGLGAAWKFSTSSSLGLNYRIETGALPEGQASRSLGLSYGYQFTPGLRVDTSLGRGLSDGAPRWGGGLSISFSH
jgi:hypothetical protein